jgi:hypothetical protein
LKRRRKMDSHVKALGWLWVISGVLSILGGLCAGASMAGGGIISEDQTALLTTSIFATLCGGSLVLGAIFDFIAAYGLFNYRSWARILAIILGILNLFLFPIGTALGIYTLWVMFNDETKALFGVTS